MLLHKGIKIYQCNTIVVRTPESYNPIQRLVLGHNKGDIMYRPNRVENKLWQIKRQYRAGQITYAEYLNNAESIRNQF